MRALKWVVILIAAGYAMHSGHRHADQAPLTEADLQPSSGEFIATAMPEGAPENTVLILAPVNCPSKAARRADALARKLTELKIPNKRGNSFSLHIRIPTSDQQAAMQRATDVLRGEVPAVFINGMGKSNPSADEVAAMYERTVARN